MVSTTKAFISIDLEGLPFIVSGEHLFVKGALYSEARKIATELTVTAAEYLHENGFDEVVIADSHGPMVNLMPEELPEYTTLVRGFPRPLAMISEAKNCDAALFLGYHAKAGTGRATFDHTYSSSSIDELRINGTPTSEFLLNAYALGYYDIPVILVAGDERLLEDDVKKFAPWIERVALKRSLSRFSAVSPSMEKIKANLKLGISNATEKFKNGEITPLKLESPVEFRVRFLGSEMADVAELLPFVERLDGKTIRYKANNIIEGYRIFELLVMAAPHLYPYTMLR
ncbi:MAG: M55 family metallopeptidase [Palaeococcus sp.]|uniref:M55 family metallopeptidase n=1 Tax=Palaeococcus sp. (in: euryarchaeotes) TaxID=2820298 RepID=UPI0025D2F20C|nr:M55 family metallopeptidase [Palaeococcus sp. (in: euryarchaeotes)]MCD6558479.1 M55 family metallopeptidase [Palaeococcus sp. (in: euryarchaeotes)]